MYYFVPRMIKYYLDQEPIIPNVPTYLASEEADKKYILENLQKLVVKAANESGGYGMLMGPKATQGGDRRVPRKNHRRAAQLHRAADVFLLAASDACGRHIVGRPAHGFAAVYHFRRKNSIVPGGLTRVALRKGSLVVNSSQGGGSKDTWVLYGDE